MTDNFDYEQHARDFLSYVEQNTLQLKKNLMKNITYNPEYFDDVFHDSIIKVYDYIMNKKTEIKSFKDFFFMVSKFAYIQEDNRHKAKLSRNIRDYFINNDIEQETTNKEARKEAIDTLFKFIAERLELFFPSNEVDIYVVYYKLKSGKNSVSYKKMANITGNDVKHITQVIKRLKKFVAEDEIINNKKKELLDL